MSSDPSLGDLFEEKDKEIAQLKIERDLERKRGNYFLTRLEAWRSLKVRTREEALASLPTLIPCGVYLSPEDRKRLKDVGEIE